MSEQDDYTPSVDVVREWPSEMGEGRLINALADALEAEHAEVERLRGELRREHEIHESAEAGNKKNSTFWYNNCKLAEKRAEHAEAALRSVPGYTSPEAFESAVRKMVAENARLTAQLQAVRERFDHLPTVDGFTVWARDTAALADVGEAEKRVLITHPHDGHGPNDRCLDAAADEPEIDEMTRADREQDERDHAFGWPKPDGGE